MPTFLRRATFALLAVAALDAAAAPCPTTSLSPSNVLPAATVGSAYSQSFTASNLNGGPFTFAITGGLPAGSGLGFTSTGATSADLTGSPTLAGNYRVTLTATDSTGCSGGRVYPLDVAQGTQTIGFTSSVPSNAQIGGAAYAVAATATSGLPVALSIDASASAICAIAGNSVTFQAAGTCVINANQAGDANWTAAPQVQQSFSVGLASQTIAFTSTAPSNATFNGTAYNVAATATSGLPVTFTIDPLASSVCTIAGSSVSFIGVGTCVVNANQAGNANYGAAPQVQQTFAVAQATQTITFTSAAPSNAAFNGTAYSVAATATSSLPVTFTIDPLASTVCTIAGSSVNFIGVGTCVVNANQAGNANYGAAPQVQQSFAVAQATQTITFTSAAPSNAAFNGTAYSVAATATSSLPVTFTIDPLASTVCTIAGSNVSFIGVGTCVVNANQAGNANYGAAPQAQQTFAVAAATQTITFTSAAPNNATFNGTAYSVAATATSGLPVTFTIDPLASSVCTIAGSSVNFIGVGTCVVNANQAGNTNYAAAPQAQQTFAVAAATQTITFTSAAPSNATFNGTAYGVAATATSGLPVTFTIDPIASSVCTIAGSNVSFIGVGTCVVNANQAGNANYAAAPQVQQTFAVGQATQTLTFTSPAPSNATFNGTAYGVIATATSGLPVTFTIDPLASSVCTIAGSNVSFIGVGTCVVNANQAGNANYAAAPQVQQTFAVGQATQTLTFTSMTPVTASVGGAGYTVAATATSGLTPVFTIAAAASTVCTITGANVSFIGSGTCVVNANQAGNANYAAAPQVQQTFTVSPGSQIITFTSSAPSNASFNGTAYSITATATSGLPVTFTIDPIASGVCTIAGSSVSFIGVGTCVVNANQAGNANFNAAPQVQQTFTVSPASQAITFATTAPTTAVVAGATYDVAATATSGLAVTFSIDASATSICSIAGSTISFQGAGTCLVNANQAGNANYAAAPQMQQSFSVGQGTQTITFSSSAPTAANSGGPTYDATATATSGLPVAFTIDASASTVCTIAGSTVSFIGAGTCVVNADQPGDANWAAATQVQQSFNVSSCLSLAVGEVADLPMPGGTTFCLSNASGAGAEYTYLPINFSTVSDFTLSLTATNIQAVTGPPTPRPGEGGLPLAPLADETEPVLDAMHAPAAFPEGHAYDMSDLVPLPMGGGTTPLVVGQLIDLNASVAGCGTPPDLRKGRVEAITTAQSAGQPLLYAVQEVREEPVGSGTWVPAVVGGFGTNEFQAIIDAFVMAPPGTTPTGHPTAGGLLKTGSMNIATSTFGMPSDVDNNGGIIVFFTKAMNELSPPASSSVVSGMFQSRDLFAAATCTGSNEAEILYMLVPDPTGSVNSNVRTVSFVYGAATTTLVHHFEHLMNASRRLYFNGAAPLESMWLDEGLAWAMQEMTFFNTSVGLVPRGNIALATLTTGPNASVRVADFNTFQNPMFGHVRTWLYQLSGTNSNKRIGPLRETIQSTGPAPTTHELGASNFAPLHWFLRYALDRKNTGDAAIFNSLVNTTLTGRTNLQAALNVNLNEWANDFLVAMYTDDAVAGVAPEYTAPSWNYRSVYGGLGGFPLTTNPLTDNTALVFNLGPGGGTRYARFGVAAGQTATVTLTAVPGNVTPSTLVTSSIVRTK